MTAHLALVLPGAGYGPGQPVLLLPALAVGQLGAEVKVVPYPNERPRQPDREVTRPFTDQVEGAVRALLAEAEPQTVTFIAKSLGTIALASLGVLPCEEVRAIWLTPIFGVDYVRHGAVDKAWPSLVVAGGADPLHDAAGHAEVVAATGGRSVVIAGGNHALEVEGHVVATVEGWAALVAAVLEFSS